MVFMEDYDLRGAISREKEDTFCDLSGAISVSCGKHKRCETSVLGLGVNAAG